MLEIEVDRVDRHLYGFHSSESYMVFGRERGKVACFLAYIILVIIYEPTVTKFHDLEKCPTTTYSPYLGRHRLAPDACDFALRLVKLKNHQLPLQQITIHDNFPSNLQPHTIQTNDLTTSLIIRKINRLSISQTLPKWSVPVSVPTPHPPTPNPSTNNLSNQSLRLVPPLSHPQSTHPELGAPSAPGVHDTLRSNLSLSTPAPKSSSSGHLDLQSSHPLESRLAQWRAQQDALKMEMLRRQFGIAEPVKRGMELNIVRAGEWRPMCLGGGVGFGGGGGGLHADILAGRDTEIGWEDVFTGDEMRDVPDFHTEMERRFGMNW